jgi:predicted DNA-binding ArsR family transcriptional regulator
MIKAKLMGKTYEDIQDILSNLGKIDILKLKDFIFDEVNQNWNIYEKTEENIKKESEQSLHYTKKSKTLK